MLLFGESSAAVEAEEALLVRASAVWERCGETYIGVGVLPRVERALALIVGESARRSSSVKCRRRRFFGGEVVAASSVAPSPPPSEELQGLLLDITVHDTMGC